MDGGRLAAVAPGTPHLDTVRALHQTVVSLRTALEVSKNELKELKHKYEQHSHCLEYTDIIEKLTIENHILRRKIIDSDYEEKEPRSQNIKLQVTYSPRHNVDEYDREVVIHTATTDTRSDVEGSEPEKGSEFCGTEELSNIEEKSESSEIKATLHVSSHDSSIESSFREEHKDYSSHRAEDSSRGEEFTTNREVNSNSSETELQESEVEDPNSQIASFVRFDTDNIPPTGFKTRLELLSKFDVRIKVRTLKEGAVISSTTSDSDSTTDETKGKAFGKDKERTDPNVNVQFEEKREHFENKEDNKGNKIHLKAVSSENIKMAVPNEADNKAKVDKFDVQVRITSEENLVVKEHTERTRRKDTLNLDVDNLSLRSMSEGDNSVFSEGGTTPQGPPAGPDDREPENSGNESEEVDDIELIFTTDESKDMTMNLQEEFVSIREGSEAEPWGASSASTHSTPVLIKFHTLDPDFQPGSGSGKTTDNAGNENQENSGLQGVVAESSLRMKRVSLPSDKDIRHVAFNGKGSLELPGRGILKSCDNRSFGALSRRSPGASARRLDSADSLTGEYNRLSFDNTKSSSFELGSSMELMEESMDSFHKNAHLGHRFSVFAETDISKCGISEDDLSGNLHLRRNTCPNPFQYRPPPRFSSRVSGPLKAGVGVGGYPGAGGGRLRPVLREGGGARREAGAQTDLCALPNNWSSDGYLAYKSSGPLGPSFPSRSPGLCRRLPPPPARSPPAARSDHSRLLLSDIGFTSMVPELSRSADPVWTLSKRQPSTDCSPVTSTSKFLSRGSSLRSPGVSFDRSADWTPHTYTPFKAEGFAAWRRSLPDVRRDDTTELLEEAEHFVRRSIDNLYCTTQHVDYPAGQTGQPYIPGEPKHLRLGHAVKVITPQGRVAVGRVRYVGVAGGSAANSAVVVGAEFPLGASPALPRNDGTHKGRRYFLASPNHTALFLPFSKVVMAWAN